ncbi:HI1506-related protein [Desulfuromonas acetoxidans]|uniref:HI1506-related protein n=1 Tax=Desulfuromonas acetoxidans TaxID=891 RepID=UPI00292E0F30|nr:HI1506-related protein [Desulfuromonas acetoxidans]
MIKITSKKAGFRRCGIAHPTTATEYPDGKFTEKQLKQLQAEPMLVIEVIAGEPDTGDDAKVSTAKELIALIEQAETVEELNALLPEGEKRTTVLEAYKKRGEDLTTAAE